MSYPLVSVIVPVYKVEAYLEQCIDSILAQKYPNLEIILVDDGSPDRCPFICDDYASRHPNIKVIHKSNEGLGMARNSGLDIAEGEYITFVDSDDKLMPHCLNQIVNSAITHQPDIILYDLVQEQADGSLRRKKEFDTERIFKGSKEITALTASIIHPFKAFGPDKISMSVCSALFNRRVLTHRFMSEREVCSEDLYFKTQACLKADKIAYIPVPAYFYRYNGTSLTRTYTIDKFFRFINLTMFMRKAYQHTDIPDWGDMTMIYGLSCGVVSVNNAKIPQSQKIKFYKQIADKKLWEQFRINRDELSTKENFIYRCLKHNNWFVPYLLSQIYYRLK